MAGAGKQRPVGGGDQFEQAADLSTGERPAGIVGGVAQLNGVVATGVGDPGDVADRLSTTGSRQRTADPEARTRTGPSRWVSRDRAATSTALARPSTAGEITPR